MRGQEALWINLQGLLLFVAIFTTSIMQRELAAERRKYVGGS